MVNQLKFFVSVFELALSKYMPFPSIWVLKPHYTDLKTDSISTLMPLIVIHTRAHTPTHMHTHTHTRRQTDTPSLFNVSTLFA